MIERFKPEFDFTNGSCENEGRIRKFCESNAATAAHVSPRTMARTWIGGCTVEGCILEANHDGVCNLGAMEEED